MVNKDQVEGRLKEGWGKLTGNEKEELKGKAQKAFGDTKKKGKETVDDAVGKVNEYMDEKENKHKK